MHTASRWERADLPKKVRHNHGFGLGRICVMASRREVGHDTAKLYVRHLNRGLHETRCGRYVRASTPHTHVEFDVNTDRACPGSCQMCHFLELAMIVHNKFSGTVEQVRGERMNLTEAPNRP